MNPSVSSMSAKIYEDVDVVSIYQVSSIVVAEILDFSPILYLTFEIVGDSITSMHVGIQENFETFRIVILKNILGKKMSCVGIKVWRYISDSYSIVFLPVSSFVLKLFSPSLFAADFAPGQVPLENFMIFQHTKVAAHEKIIPVTVLSIWI